MTIKTRWIENIAEQSAKTDIQLPFARGKNRARLMARFKAEDAKTSKKAAA